MHRSTKNQSAADLMQFAGIENLWRSDVESGYMSLIERVDSFPRYASRQALARFLTKVELFRRVLDVHGSIIEVGVLNGAGLLAWAKLSSIFEPVNHTRRVIGFDTFSGLRGVGTKDFSGPEGEHYEDMKDGALQGMSRMQVQAGVDLYDLNRPLAHIPKVELVEGDVRETAARYVAEHPALMVALLYLDVDLYAPTLAALRAFVPLMPRGAIIAFDELGSELWPGETMALRDYEGLFALGLERFAFDPWVSYAVL